MKIFHFLNVLLLFSIITEKTAAQNVRSADSLALVALYNATGGPNWTDNTNWLNGSPDNTWFGVFVSGRYVTEIDLFNNNLTGPIPPEIGNLVALQWLNLSNNNLTGPILPEIGNLTEKSSMIMERTF